MKKFYFLFVALLIGAFAANAADWYLVGANYGWSDKASNKFTPTENANEYSLTVASLSGEIKIKEAGKWNTSFGSNGSKLQEGVLYNAGTDGGNIMVDGTIADATITINTAYHTVIARGAASENEYTCVYLVGDFGSGWSEGNTNYPLELKSGTDNVYVGHYTLTAATTYFKMKAGTYVYGTGGSDITVVLGQEYTASQSGEAFRLGAGEYDFTYVLNHNADTGVLTVTSEVPVTYPETFYIVGYVNGSTAFVPESTVALNTIDRENGIYEADVTLTGADGGAYSYFSFCTHAGTAGDWNSLGTRYGAEQSDKEVVLDQPMTLVGGEHSFKASVGEFNVKVDLKNHTVTVSEVENNFDVIYLVGNLDGTDFNTELTTHPLTMKSGTDNTFTGEYTFTTAAYIKLRAGNLVLGTGGSDINVVSGTEYPATVAGDAFVLEPGKYEFQVLMNHGSREAKFTATKTGDVVITFPENLYLIGNFGGEAFAANSTAALTNEGDGIYTAEAVEFTANPEDAAKSFFQLCTASGADADDWANVGTRYMAQNPDQLVESEQEYTILPASEFPNSWYVVPGKYDVRVDLDRMTIMLTFIPEVVTYPELVVIGDFCDWTMSTAVPMTRENNVYTASMERLNAGVGFKIAEKVADGEPWALNWGGSDPEGGTNPEILTLGTPANAWQTSSVNFQVPNDIKDVTITFTYDTENLGSIKVTGTDATGVENIAVDADTEAEYYNLQGVRVDNPRGGIFIRRTGTTAVKVAL